MKIGDIAATTGLDGIKLGALLPSCITAGPLRHLLSVLVERVLRLLVTQGWYREPKQGCFANNRLSNLIKKEQPGWHLITYMFVLFLNHLPLTLTNSVFLL